VKIGPNYRKKIIDVALVADTTRYMKKNNIQISDTTQYR